MKKLIAVSVLGVIVGFGGVAMACQGSGCFESNYGYLDVQSNAYGFGSSSDFASTTNGYSSGFGSSIGASQGGVGGYVNNGTIEGDSWSQGGGFSDTVAWGDDNMVGTETSNYTIAGGGLSAKVDPGYDGDGYFYGSFSGSASQGSSSYSEMNTPSDWTSTGFSGGLAEQQSNGSFNGGISGWSGADYTTCGGNCVDSYAGANVDAGIEMEGSSYSQTQIYSSNTGSTVVEGMRNDVGAKTSITSFASKDRYKNGNAGSSAWLGTNCFEASGLLSSASYQSSQTGYASAGAVGGYTGGGEFGGQYNGEAVGYTQTSLTTTAANGSISFAAAGMKVTSFNGESCVGCD